MTKKYIVIGIIAIVTLIVGVIVFFLLKSKISNEIKEAENTQEANKEIDSSKLSLTTSQYNTIASKLYAAMAGMGTDEDAIYDAFRGINNYSDLMRVMQAFGSKDNMTLREWLYDDCGADEINKINEILASKNINYKF